MQMKKKDTRPLMTVDQLENFVKENDFTFWFNRVLIKDAAEQLQAKYGQRIVRQRLKEAIEKNCKWWKKRHRRREAYGVLLSADQWNKLRNAVLRHKSEITNMPIEHAAAIVCQWCRTNALQLDGLMSELHFWKQT